MAIDKQTLRQSFGSFMTGVTIVTAMNDHDVPVGFTANSFTSVSLDPALLLICIDKKSENIDTFTKGNGFAVNVLSHHQQEISNRFASPIEDRFDGVDWHKSDHNNPILSDVTAYFDCLLDQVIDAGIIISFLAWSKIVRHLPFMVRLSPWPVFFAQWRAV